MSAASTDLDVRSAPRGAEGDRAPRAPKRGSKVESRPWTAADLDDLLVRLDEGQPNDIIIRATLRPFRDLVEIAKKIAPLSKFPDYRGTFVAGRPFEMLRLIVRTDRDYDWRDHHTLPKAATYRTRSPEEFEETRLVLEAGADPALFGERGPTIDAPTSEALVVVLLVRARGGQTPITTLHRDGRQVVDRITGALTARADTKWWVQRLRADGITTEPLLDHRAGPERLRDLLGG